MSDFEARQILIVHESLWDAMKRWASDHRFYLDRIPDGADDEGRAFFREDRPETECPRCGHTPTYAFAPKMLGDQ
jgi:hypothetical protein